MESGSVPLGFLPDNTPVGDSDEGFPVQLAPGLPFGIVLLGGRWSEQTLLGCGYALEQSMKVRSRRRPLEDAIPRSQLPGFSRRVDGSKTSTTKRPMEGREQVISAIAAILTITAVLATLLLAHWHNEWIFVCVGQYVS
jgi:hypothetical protein